MNEPRIEPIDGGVCVTCVCGSRIEIKLELPPPERPKYPWRFVALVSLGAVAVGQMVGLASKWLPAWLFISVMAIGGTCMIRWMVRQNRQMDRDMEQQRKYMASMTNRNNARWQ